MTFIYEPVYSQNVGLLADQKLTVYVKAFKSHRITLYRQTYRQNVTKTIARRFADGKNSLYRVTHKPDHFQQFGTHAIHISTYSVSRVYIKFYRI